MIVEKFREKLQKTWGSIISGRLHRALIDKIMALKLTISTFII